jgi:lysophospholipase L1-like esterase
MISYLQTAKTSTMLMLLSCIILLSCSKTPPPVETEYDSIGVYGGSISSTPVSDYAKQLWQSELNIPVVTHGVGGAGFTQNTTQPNIPAQIDQSPAHDIVVLWCSTNDSSAPLESEDMYSVATQNGGMRISIEKLKAKNPDCIILGFCSLPSFDGRNIATLVENQIKVFEEYNIPYLNQYKFFTVEDVAEMYSSDKIHLSVSGYVAIRERQTEFIRENIKQ